jgi:hydrogenase-1 operon protein HyaE
MTLLSTIDLSAPDAPATPASDSGSSTLVPLPVQAPAQTGSALVARLANQFGSTWVDARSVTAWAAEGGDRVVLLAGDPVRFPEGQDVAAVLPELQRAVAVPMALGVVAPADEDALARRYGVQRWPSLLFLRDGGYVGTLAGMHDWLPFVDQVRALLATPVSRAPGIGIPLVSAGGDAPGCH